MGSVRPIGRRLRAPCLAFAAGLVATAAFAEPFRIASYHTGLSRDGPGLLLGDLADAEDAEIAATLDVMEALAADILVLQDMDWDAGGLALATLAERLAERGRDYPHRLALRPNTGRPTGHDLDGDGRSHRGRDAHGYGLFSGEGGMALLSRFPIIAVRDFSDLLWRDLPDTAAPGVVPVAALPILRLASVGAWDVTLATPDGPVNLLMGHAVPPVFDGPEDRNGLRNADETRFWQLYLDGWAHGGVPFDGETPIFAGTLNVDPQRGEGRPEALRALLGHPALQDPAPTGAGGTATADWEEPTPGDLRVDYILPSRRLTVLDHGVWWSDDAHDLPLSEASDHRPVWMDLRF